MGTHGWSTVHADAFLGLGLVLVLLAPGAGADPIPPALTGLVAPSEPATVDGRLEPRGGSMVLATQHAEPAALFEARRAAILLYRDRVPAVDPHEPRLTEPMQAQWSPFSERFEARDPRLRLLTTEPLLRASTDLGGPVPTNATLADARCTVAPVATNGAPPSVQVGHALRVTCTAAEVRLDRAPLVRLEGNATLRLEYEDATGHVARDVQLRSASTDPATWATAWDGLEVIVAPEDAAEARWRFRTPQEVAVHAPAVALAGRLQLPTGSGRVVWAARELGPRVPALDATGSFALASYSERYMDLRGRAWGAAPQPAAVAPPAPATAGLGVAGIAAAGLLGLAAFLLRGPAALLFTRLTHDHALDHARRAAIADAVAAQPGARIQDVARTVGIHKAVAAYHVRVLERQGVIVLGHWGRRTALFLRDRYPPAVQRHFIHLRRRCVPELLQRLRARPGARQDEVARDLGLSRSRVAVLVKDLEEAGLLRRTRTPQGRTVYDVASPVAPVT